MIPIGQVVERGWGMVHLRMVYRTMLADGGGHRSCSFHLTHISGKGKVGTPLELWGQPVPGLAKEPGPRTELGD